MDYWIAGWLENNQGDIYWRTPPSIHPCINPSFDMAEETKNAEATRGNRKERVGEVISNKMTKTIIVRVERRFPHRKYKKVVTGYMKFYAHDEKGDAKVGDRVRIEETRPLSKLKRWRLVEVVERGKGVAPVAV
jgi:small subunit ribosomal protein S17